MVGMLRAGSSLAFADAARVCCRLAVCRGPFGCADTPCGLVVSVGEAIVGILA